MVVFIELPDMYMTHQYSWYFVNILGDNFSRRFAPFSSRIFPSI